MLSTKLQKTFIFFILFVLICSSISTIGVSEDSNQEKNSKIKKIDNIIDEGTLSGVGVSTAVYAENNIVYLLGIRTYEKDLYMKYNLSNHKSKVILKGQYGIPGLDDLPAVYYGENIYIFGARVKKEGGYKKTDKIFKLNLEKNELIELNITLPTEGKEDVPAYVMSVVFDGGEIYLLWGKKVYTFNPEEKSIKEQEFNPPENFEGFGSNRNTVLVDRKVYCFNEDEIYAFDINKKKINKIGEIPTNNPDAWRRSAVYTGEYIYLIGGGGLSQEIIDEIIRFDPETKEAKLLDLSLPEPLHGCNLIHNGKYIYIFGANKELDPNSKHGTNVNVVYRINYQGLKENDDYPGIEDNNDDLNIYLWMFVGIVIMVSIGGTIYFIKYRK